MRLMNPKPSKYRNFVLMDTEFSFPFTMSCFLIQININMDTCYF